MRRAALVVSMGLAAGCGPRAFIEVHVESSLAVPGHVDGLTATLLEDDRETERHEHVFTLDAADAFPMSFVLEPSGDTPHDVVLRVLATKGDETVGAGAIAFTWQDDRVNEVAVVVAP